MMKQKSGISRMHGHQRAAELQVHKEGSGPAYHGARSQRATAASRLRDLFPPFTLLHPPSSTVRSSPALAFVFPCSDNSGARSTPLAIHFQECSLRVPIAFACLQGRSWVPSNNGGARRRSRSSCLPSAPVVPVVDHAAHQFPLCISNPILQSHRCARRISPSTAPNDTYPSYPAGLPQTLKGVYNVRSRARLAYELRCSSSRICSPSRRGCAAAAGHEHKRA
jgi:hypothetical protein